MAERTMPGTGAGGYAAAGALPDTDSPLGSKYTIADAASPISTSPSAALVRGANHLARSAEEMKSCATRLTLNMRGAIARERRSRQIADTEAPCLR